MTAKPTAEQRQRLESLRRAYILELPEKVRAIEEAAAALGGADVETLRTLHHLVHRLTGSSGVWGFGRLNRAAAALERMVFTACDGTAPVPLHEDPVLPVLLAALKAEAAAVRFSTE